ncbi:hypothetical protein EVAR_101980_1 [Eumeta japonica]|uniref:Uncharacterized protein n=1 Tax=Eumeta variegata TaxID=151549 RepID=A0A4C1TSH1_EUMVA|nr:hypothetical protein EVAR_101980_1 [Eumeta japonica]
MYAGTVIVTELRDEGAWCVAVEMCYGCTRIMSSPRLHVISCNSIEASRAHCRLSWPTLKRCPATNGHRGTPLFGTQSRRAYSIVCPVAIHVFLLKSVTCSTVRKFNLTFGPSMAHYSTHVTCCIFFPTKAFSVSEHLAFIAASNIYEIYDFKSIPADTDVTQFDYG